MKSDEVEQFLRTNKTQYAGLLREITNLFSPTGPLPVRDVYSRKTKQGDSELKDVTKIARALYYERQKTPNAAPASIDDIVGITVVCDYHSDINTIKKFVRTQQR